MDKKYKEYLLSDEWAQLKIDLFNHRGRCCEKCNRKKNLSVHHLTYENIYNEEPEDLIILCRLCHAKVQGKIKKYKKKKIKRKQPIKPKVKKKPKSKKGSICFVKLDNCTMVITRKKQHKKG
jgi:5-methylcytosine-specific restriction endonuclease McrA